MERDRMPEYCYVAETEREYELIVNLAKANSVSYSLRYDGDLHCYVFLSANPIPACAFWRKPVAIYWKGVY